MDHSYDADLDVLTITLRADAQVESTVQVDETRKVMLDPCGMPVGIEIKQASQDLQVDDLIERFGLAYRRTELQAVATVLRAEIQG